MAELSKNGNTVAMNRYFHNNEDWQGCAERSGFGAASVENGDRRKYADEFSKMIFDLEFLPGGRILRNIGRARGSLFNCYVLPIGDSIEEIGQFLKDALILWSEGGGVGTNLSYLRPRGTPIKGKGGVSSGPVSFLEAADSIANTIESGGSRRAAALACMHVNHPDIFEFIDTKLVHGKLSHFNLSVGVDNSFLEAVESDADWEFSFAQQSHGVVKARDIWDKIVNNMVSCAEPGLLHWGNLIKNNSYYFDPIISTNPCGEVALGAYGCCDLGSIVLPSFISNVNTNWKKLGEIIKLAIRFLDNIIELNKYVLGDIDRNAHNGRRVGLGIMGLAEYLFAKKLRYGSRKAIDETERLVRFIRDISYEASVELAMEKGAFPKFDTSAYSKSSFIRKLPAALRMDVKRYGIRNVTTMAIAPTGTISLLPEVSSGIEPLFLKAYKRHDRVSERMYVHEIYRDIIAKKEATPDWFVDTSDLKPEDHFEMQSIVQKYVDGAVSKTINMPTNTTPEQLSALMLEYIYDLKGVTIYVDGSREGQVLKGISKKEVKEHLKGNEEDVTMAEESVLCATGDCEI